MTSDEGYFTVYRRVFRHEAFRKPAEAGLFVYLMSEARWREGVERTPDGPVRTPARPASHSRA